MSDLTASIPTHGERLLSALRFTGRVTEPQHNFYKYPARFCPQFAREFICQLTEVDDLVLDPFMGGATSIVEALMLGRRAVGIDLNALAHFIATVRTTPLSATDINAIEKWLVSPSRHAHSPTGQIKNLPPDVEQFVGRALASIGSLKLPRQQRFARAILLRLGQWALDARESQKVCTSVLENQLMKIASELFDAVITFVDSCQIKGVHKNKITSRRILLHRSTIGIETDRRLASIRGKVRLVITSPPYPGVHVLYHRWQIRGRKETPAPYWIADVPDGQPESYYTFATRKPSGFEKYYQTVATTFTSIRPMLAREGIVAQLVAFPDVEYHLPSYLNAMEQAGFVETEVNGLRSGESRTVPNRKWYARITANADTSREILLLHRPR